MTDRFTDTIEDEPFSRFIHDIIKKIAKDLVPKDWEPPKHIFIAPGEILKKDLRRGPMITSKEGKKHVNYYMPFSFVKTVECREFPPSSKANMVDLASNIHKNLDAINNKYSLKEAITAMPYFKKYIRLSYALADKCRTQWVSHQRILRDPGLIDSVSRGFKSFEEKKDKGDLARKLSEICNNIAVCVDRATFVNASNNPEERRLMATAVGASIAEKKARRTVAPSSRK